MYGADGVSIGVVMAAAVARLRMHVVVNVEGTVGVARLLPPRYVPDDEGNLHSRGQD